MKMSAIVRHYTMFHRTRKEGELDWFRSQPRFEDTIEKAALAIDKCGMRMSHQRRIKARALREAKTALLLVKLDLSNCKNFESLHSVVKAAVELIEGIGPLYVYDVSERIGAKLGLRPEKVYLHTGAAVGAKNLGFDGSVELIEVSEFPLALQCLKPDEVEDILCIYKNEFE